jgi:two-component system chemotaxis sensor kinase CheA
MDIAKYRGLFISESREHLDAMNQGLVRLEGSPGDRETIDQVFRDAHSLKGMAASMGFTPVAAVAHRLESLMDRVRSKGIHFGGALSDAVFSGVDLLSSMIAAVDEGREIPPCDVWTGETEGLLGEAPSAPTATQAGAEGEVIDLAPEDEVASPSWQKLTVIAEVDPESPARAARAFILIRDLGGIGKVLRSDPPASDLRKGVIGERLTATIMTDRTADELHEFVSAHADLLGVEVTGEEPGEVLPEPSTPDLFRKTTSVKIPTNTIDGLINIVGELLLLRGTLEQIARDRGLPELSDGVDRLGRLTRGFQDTVMAIRMMPVEFLLDRLPRLVRDLSRMLDREVHFEVLGRGIEVDRNVLEELSDPLIHLLRNALDHGVESPAERRVAGKDPRGIVRVVAYREKDLLCIRVEDDGRGVDREALRRRGVERGLLPAGREEELSAREALDLLCAPGFSTKSEVTDLSGRGVGMDIVRNSIQALGGSLELASEPGQGTRITMRVPLTLAIVQIVEVLIGGERLGIPITMVNFTGEIQREELQYSGDRGYLPVQGIFLPFVEIAPLLGLSPRRDAAAAIAYVLTETRGEPRAIGIDGFIGRREVVIKPLGSLLVRLKTYSGVTVGEDGRPVLILDLGVLLDR